MVPTDSSSESQQSQCSTVQTLPSSAASSHSVELEQVKAKHVELVELTVTALDGKSACFHLQEGSLVAELKTLIRGLWGVPLQCQTLLMEHTELNDAMRLDRSISSCQLLVQVEPLIKFLQEDLSTMHRWCDTIELLESLESWEHAGNDSIVGVVLSMMLDRRAQSCVRHLARKTIREIVSPPDRRVASAALFAFRDLSDLDGEGEIFDVGDVLCSFAEKGSDTIVPQLVRQLFASSGLVLVACMETLQKVAAQGDPAVIAAMMKLLQSRSAGFDDVRRAAIETLSCIGGCGHQGVLDTLRQLLTVSILDQRTCVLQALSLVVCRGDANLVNEVIPILKERIDRPTQLAAAEVLAKAVDGANPAMIRDLISVLEESEHMVRCDALDVLCRVACRGDTAVVHALIIRLQDMHSWVRRQALRALSIVANQGDAKAITAAKKALIDKSWLVRQSAVDALKDMIADIEEKDACFNSALQTWLHELSDEAIWSKSLYHEGLDDRKARQLVANLIAQLARRGNPRAIAFVTKQLHAKLDGPNYRDWNVRAAFLTALGQVAEKGCLAAAELILSHLEWEGVCPFQAHEQTLSAVLIELMEKGDRQTVDLLEGKLKSSDWSVRCKALFVLSQVSVPGDSRAIRLAGMCLKDGLSTVRNDALDTLSKLSVRGDQFVVCSIIPMLTDPDSSVRCRVLSLLRQLMQTAEPSTIIAVTARLKDDEEYVRKEAIDTLATIAVM